jgi:hypothetical protein
VRSLFVAYSVHNYIEHASVSIHRRQHIEALQWLYALLCRLAITDDSESGGLQLLIHYAYEKLLHSKIYAVLRIVQVARVAVMTTCR